MKKATQSVSVISGADGPTSIFLVGKGHKPPNIIQRIKNNYKSWKYNKKRERAITQIKAGAHSMQETVKYITKQYGAVEKDSTYSFYEEQKYCMKYSLIQREQPELLGDEDKKILPKDMDFDNKNSLIEYMREVDAWNNHCMERVKQLSKDAFSMEYHLYVIDCGTVGKIEIEMEDVRGVMGISSTGNIRKLQKIKKDICLFYGVTQEDIDNSTHRYKYLIADLSY